VDRAGALAVKGRIIGTIFCLLFAIPFGGVGLWATGTFASTLRDSWSARDWVLVRADVTAAERVASSGRSSSVRATGTYRYTFEGKEYTGSRLSITTMDGGDNIGDWQEEMAEFLLAAKKRERRVDVFVNPANPAQAVLDRNVRWPVMLFLVPFMVLFGGVGIAALAGAWFIATRPAEGTPRALERARAKRSRTLTLGSSSRMWQIWGFAILWSSIAFPMAGMAMPQIIQRGDWLGYLVLLFPLVGVLLLWAALASTWTEIRKRMSGNATPGQGAVATPPAAAHHKFATDRPASFYEPDGAPQKAFAPEVAIPPEVVAIEERGNRIRLDYPGGLFASLFGRLTVTAGDGQLLVEKAGVFGRKEFRAAASAVTAIVPALSYTVMSGSQQRRYYSLSATTRDGARIPLGSGIQNDEVATAIALRIAAALKLAPERVSRARPA
jgi:hypothetical protein